MKWLANSLMIISLISCGGGSSNEDTSDTQAPSIVTTQPGNNSEGVSLEAPLTITFNEPVATTSINSNNIDLQYPIEDGEWQSINTALNLSVDGTTVTITSTTELPDDLPLRLFVQNIEDLSANKMTDLNEINFVTRAKQVMMDQEFLTVRSLDGFVNSLSDQAVMRDDASGDADLVWIHNEAFSSQIKRVSYDFSNSLWGTVTDIVTPTITDTSDVAYYVLKNSPVAMNGQYVIRYGLDNNNLHQQTLRAAQVGGDIGIERLMFSSPSSNDRYRDSPVESLSMNDALSGFADFFPTISEELPSAGGSGDCGRQNFTIGDNNTVLTSAPENFLNVNNLNIECKQMRIDELGNTYLLFHTENDILRFSVKAVGSNFWSAPITLSAGQTEDRNNLYDETIRSMELLPDGSGIFFYWTEINPAEIRVLRGRFYDFATQELSSIIVLDDNEQGLLFNYTSLSYQNNDTGDAILLWTATGGISVTTALYALRLSDYINPISDEFIVSRDPIMGVNPLTINRSVDQYGTINIHYIVSDILFANVGETTAELRTRRYKKSTGWGEEHTVHSYNNLHSNWGTLGDSYVGDTGNAIISFQTRVINSGVITSTLRAVPFR